MASEQAVTALMGRVKPLSVRRVVAIKLCRVTS